MLQRLRSYFKGDKVIWAVVIALMLFSILAVSTSTDALAYRSQGKNASYFIMKHAVILLFCFGIILVVHNIHYKYYSKLSQLFILIAIPLLIVTMFMGKDLNEARRGLSLPIIGLTIQSSDFAKLAIIMYISRLLSVKQTVIKDLKSGFLPIITPVVIVCILILPNNFSTAAMLLFISVILLFIGRVQIKHILVFSGLGVAGIGLMFLIYFAAPEAVSKALPRVGTWVSRYEDFSKGKSDEVYQVEQAKIAISTGGLIGKGPGKSTQRVYLPLPFSDFIYAIIIEEYGLLFGAIPVLLLYLYLFYRAGTIVRKCKRTFPAFLVMGLALSIVIQAMINMAVTVNLLPVTGQPLPMVSMGGSSLLFTSISFGIMLSVSRSVQENEIEQEDEQEEA